MKEGAVVLRADDSLDAMSRYTQHTQAATLLHATSLLYPAQVER